MKLWHAIAIVNLAVLAADHFVTSVAGILFPERAVRLYQRLFGAKIPLTQEMVAVLKPWGALGIFAAIVGLLPILDPFRYRGILYALLALLFMRVMIRIGNARRAQQHFGVSRARNLFHIGLIVLCAAIIAVQLLWW